jgi:hypothetical protein
MATEKSQDSTESYFHSGMAPTIIPASALHTCLAGQVSDLLLLWLPRPSHFHRVLASLRPCSQTPRGQPAMYHLKQVK